MKGKLLYNEGKFFCTKMDLLNFMLTLTLAKLDMVGTQFGSNGLILLGNTPVNIQLITFLLLSSVIELSTGTKTKRFW